jgi:hypothetical protein
MDNSSGLNKNVLIGAGGLLVVLIAVVVFLMVRQQNNAGQAGATATLTLPGTTPGRASGYQGANLMPAVPGSAAANAAATGTAPVGHATGYQGAQLMPAVPGAGGAGATGGAAAPPAAPVRASGYSNANLMPAPGAPPGR